VIGKREAAVELAGMSLLGGVAADDRARICPLDRPEESSRNDERDAILVYAFACFRSGICAVL
jgi:hypothetical protein